MKALLVAEKKLNVDLISIAENLNGICNGLKFFVSRSELEIESEYISVPSSYDSLDESIIKETENYDYSFLFTGKRYDNNYFFQTAEKKAIISFSGWEKLTKLSKNNGVVYFIADLLALHIDNSFRHNNITGCIYDFIWDKTAIDLGMRNAFICSSCLERISTKKLSDYQREIYADLKEILNFLGNASKWDKDIVAYLKNSNNQKMQGKPNSTTHDVFLAHNSKDKPLITIICAELRKRGLNPWLDSEQIPPGRFFQDVIQDIIAKIPSVAVFIGEQGLGRWQGLEQKSVISQCIDRKIPVIPVLLPNVSKLPDELIFLNEFSWVTFKTDINDEDALDNLIWGITGRHPKK